MTNLAELVFVPTPSMGHIIPIVEFAKLILERNQRISVSIYIISASVNSAKLKSFVDAQSRVNLHPTRLIFVTLPSLPNVSSPSSPSSLATVIELHKSLVKQAVEDRINARLGKPIGFVLDMFCVGFVDIARELNVPSYIFFTCSAGVLNLQFYAQSLADDHGVDVATKFSDPGSSLVVPGFKHPVTSKVIPEVLQDKDGGCELFLNFARMFRETNGILINTFEDLELFTIQALFNSDDKSIPPIYPVGPTLELNNKIRGGSDNNEESVIQWLDGQPKCSVVFLCFGSMGSFEEEQVKEIAKGLDKLEYRFLWALRKPPMEGKRGGPNDNEPFLEALPEGFIDRTINKGKIIGWAPQAEVLAHPSIGGFVSHCGWNSTLESVWFGVPMATWPMAGEQQLNAFELVKELELAVEIRMDYRCSLIVTKGNFLVKAEEIEKAIKKLMNMDEKTKENVKKMSDLARKAIKDGGSSYNNMRQFINDVLSEVP